MVCKLHRPEFQKLVELQRREKRLLSQMQREGNAEECKRLDPFYDGEIANRTRKLGRGHSPSPCFYCAEVAQLAEHRTYDAAEVVGSSPAFGL